MKSVRILVPIAPVLAAVILASCGKQQPAPAAKPSQPAEAKAVLEVTLPEKVDVVTFSRDRAHIAFEISRDKNVHAVIDGREERGYEAITAILFSPNGKHYYYGGKRGGKWQLVRDGQEIAELESLTNLSRGIPVLKYLGDPSGFGLRMSETLAIWFAEKADNYLVIGYQGGKGRIFKDGAWLPVQFNSFNHQGWAVSPDGQHYSYAIEPVGGSKTAMYLDGQAGPSPEDIDGASYIEPTNRLVYRAKKGSEWLLMNNAEPQTGHAPVVGNLEISEDNRHVAALVQKTGGVQAVVVDGVEETPFKTVAWQQSVGPFTLRGSFVWNVNATAHAYVAAASQGEKGPRAIVLNGKTIDQPAAVRSPSLAITDDGKIAAYVVGTEKHWAVAVNGVVRGTHTEVISPVFPGGWSTPVYATKDGDGGGWVLQGLRAPLKYADIADITAGPSGRVAYAAKVDGGKWRVFINEQPVSKPYDGIAAPIGLRFVDRTLLFVAKEGQKLVSLKVAF